MVTVQVIEDLKGLDTLQPAWDFLMPMTEWAGPMLHHLWLRTFVDVCGAEKALAVVVAGKPGVVAIAPLSRSRTPLKRLEFLGQEELSEAMDFLYQEGADLDVLAEAVARIGCPISLKRLPANSSALPALKRAYRHRGIVVVRPSAGCPWIALDKSWIEPEQHVNSGRRSDLRRARRNAEKLGGLACEIHTPSASEVGRLLDEAFRVETESWKGREGTSLSVDKTIGEYYRSYLVRACERGILRICFLHIGGNAAAMQLAIETGNRFWLLKIGRSDQFARCSPGVLLMIETIRHAARSGLQSYEFLGTAEPWVRTWTKLERPCVLFRAYPFGIRGMAALAVDVAEALLGWAKRGGAPA